MGVLIQAVKSLREAPGVFTEAVRVLLGGMRVLV